MAGIKYFSQNISVEEKTIILRLDLNVPLQDGKIQDDTRISLAIPFLKELIKRKSKLIIISHLGRPKGVRNNNLSLIPVYKYLKKKINTNIYFFTGDINEETKKKSSFLKPGEVMLLENIRFFKEEEENNETFS